jgi:hypothetical protein
VETAKFGITSQCLKPNRNNFQHFD